MKIEEIENAINPAVESHGCILWGIDLLRGKKRPIIRIFIDAIAGATITCPQMIKVNHNLSKKVLLCFRTLTVPRAWSHISFAKKVE